MPPEIFSGNTYGKLDNKRPPIDLSEALHHFKNSSFAKECFTPAEHEYLVEFYNNEVEEYEGNIIKWELNRYLDLI